MRITKTTNFRKTTATTLLLSLLVPAISAAGQFNALYAGASEAEKSAYETWLQFYPDLNSQIRQAFDVSNAEGNFVFSSNKLPVAWDVNARLDIKVDSINVGYFLSLRNPSNGQLLFPGLTVESQNVQISAGHDLIVSPIPAEEGFGYALSVGYKQKAVLSADNRIILKEPGIGTGPTRNINKKIE